MNDQIIKTLLTEIREVKAMLRSLGAVRVDPSVTQEIAACRAQGVDIAAFFKAKGKAAPRRKNISKKEVRK